MAASIEQAREAFAQRQWAVACDAFAKAGGQSAADHQRHAVAAYLTGADGACERAWEAAYRAAIEARDLQDAARSAFWLALCFMLRGQMAQAGGWLARSQAAIDDAGRECAASGYLLIPELLRAIDGDDAEHARRLAMQAIEIAKRCDDRDLWAFAVLGLGQALIKLGDTTGGIARLDEVMVAVTADEVGPITSGIVYCAVILECMAVFDVQRAAEWTGALSDWCDPQPDLVPYRGQCLVHRSQLQMFAGQWPDASTTVASACRRLSDPPQPALGLAYYQEGELHRLVGAFDESEAAYRRASRHGHDPVPGVPLLQLARGDTDAAMTTIRRALTESRTPVLLAGAVDVLRAGGDFVGARTAADALVAIASSASSPVLDAMAAQATGAVLISEGDPVAALTELRRAARTWQSVQMPYETARTAALLGLALTAMGDRRAAELEFDNARAIFTELGARPDLDRLDALAGTRPVASDDAGLSDREREVLTQLASGKTNREIAAVLHISQHTVGRHVENVFTKLGVTSRAAATARAFELGLLAR